MGIPESQLQTWSHQGAVTTAKTTHESIRNALAANTSPIRDKSYEVYLQGSYKNTTNIRGDSDVDVVAQLNSTFQDDLSALPLAQEPCPPMH
jgi:tRNA nucleotidyltransferase (CCA-adding enzyme)